MRRDNTGWGPTPAASLVWDENGEPFSRRFDDVYYNTVNGMAESRHVFLHGNGLPARWNHFNNNAFCIAETGFGTGLNFLLTWQAWRQQANTRPRLHFISIEKYPLDKTQLAKALQSWPELAEFAAELLAAWPGCLAGQHRLNFDAGRVVLDLWWEDAAAALTDLACNGPVVDAWYLDGFSPSRNPDMWQPGMFSEMASLSRKGATVATFTAASLVRRGLEDAGFSMQKVPGFGLKRESMMGTARAEKVHSQPSETPWDLDASSPGNVGSAIIIGAGLAGATLAHALAARGIEVTVLEQGAVAGEASGNEQGILYTRLSRRHSSLTDFGLQSFRYSSTLYRQMFASGQLENGCDGQLCGSFHQHNDSEELILMQEKLAGLEDLAAVLDPSQAKEHLGVEPAMAGYWYPDSGWLRPPSICRVLLDNPGITVFSQCGAFELQRNKRRWQALNASGECVASADVAIVCAGTASNSLHSLNWLPLQPIRGQTSYLPAGAATSGLRAALCHKGYISPAYQGRHCIGASFTLHDADKALRASEHSDNVEKLLNAIPQWRQAFSELDPAQMQGRVGFRCASPDYLPIAGPVPDRPRFLQDYAALRKNARQVITHRGSYVPGLYVNTAHGSRGLTSAPLCAQVLAASICGEAPPLSRELLRALSPARFLIRDLSRNKI